MQSCISVSEGRLWLEKLQVSPRQLSFRLDIFHYKDSMDQKCLFLILEGLNYREKEHHKKKMPKKKRKMKLSLKHLVLLSFSNLECFKYRVA